MCNGAAKQVSEGVAPCSMVGFVKHFELPLLDKFHKVYYKVKLLFLSPLGSSRPSQKYNLVLLFAKLVSQGKFKKFHENRPLHAATPGELVSQHCYTQVSAKSFNV